MAIFVEDRDFNSYQPCIFRLRYIGVSSS